MLNYHSTMLSLLLLLSVIKVDFNVAVEIYSRSRVSKNGNQIIFQSDMRNRTSDRLPTRGTDVDSMLIDKSIIKNRNETIKNFTEEQEETKTGDKSEKSTGRAIQSNFYFPLKNLLMNPVQSNRYNNEKAGRLIVYPSSHSVVKSNTIDQTRRRYYMNPSTGYNTAHRRYQYTPDSIYPFKGKEHTIGNQYNKAPTANSVKFNAPIVVADLSSAATKFNAPIVVPDTPSAATKFTAPIFVPDVPSSPSKPVYLTPNMLSASPPKSSYISNMNLGGTVFLPTPLPDETTSKNPSFDLLAFPSHINSSYIPDELDAIKDSIDNNNHQLKFGNDKDNTISSSDTSESPSNEDSNYIEISPEDIMKIKEINNIKSRYKNLPQNIEIVYQPPRLPTEAKLPIMSVSQHMQNVNDTMKSLIMTNNNQPMMTSISLNSSNNEDDDDDEKPYVAPKNLFSFPPNINSVYLPPGMKPTKSPINSYLPPPSGDVPSDDNVQNSEEDSSNQISYIPPKDFYNFPPNIKSTYLPPDYKYPKNPGNSYSPPASGSELNPVLSYMNMMNILPSKNLSPPKDQITFLPPKMNQQMTSGYNYFPPISGSVNGQMMPSPMTPAPMQMPQQMQMIDQMPMTSPDMDQPMNYGMGESDMMGPPMSDYTGPHMSDIMGHDHHSPWHGDVIYDDPHHHQHHHEPEATTTTTEAPEEPRLKKYSYYYLGRKLWYIPLYFTLYFTIYVSILIIRSIGRHKVDLPNHYQRSLHDLSQKETLEKINKITAFTMKQIEDFKEKYL